MLPSRRIDFLSVLISRWIILPLASKPKNIFIYIRWLDLSNDADFILLNKKFQQM